MDKSSDRTWESLGAASGIAAAVLGGVGFGLLASSATFIPVGASQEQIARALAAPAAPRVFAGEFLQSLAQLLLLVFAARLWLTLRRAEGAPGWLSAAAFGAALLMIAAGAGAVASEYAIALGAGHGLDVQGAGALHFLNMAFYVSIWGSSALFSGAIAVVGLRGRALPRWLGWSAAAIAVANLAGLAVPTADLAQIPPLFFRLWLLAVGIALLRRVGEPRPSVESVPVPQPSRAS